MIKTLYFCENCRKKIDDVSELHYIEDNSDRGFCSDTCIMEFYRPYLNWLEKEEIKLRKDLNIEQETPFLDITADQKILQKALKNPSEVWVLTNDIDQSFYTHILKIHRESQVIYYILVCSYIDGGPSFVFYRTATTHIELVDRYRREFEYQEYSEQKELGEKIPSEFFELVEHKKSSLLAQMLQERSIHDISFEDFIHYDDYLKQTIEAPDEVFENEDQEGDTLLTYIKTFHLAEDDLNFFYIVIGMNYESEDQVYLIPIIGFPSVDKKLYPTYAKGTKTLNKLKN